MALSIPSPARVRAAVLAVCIAAGLTACTTPARRTATSPTVRIAVPDVVRVRVAGRILSVPLDDYVLGAALAEVVPVDEPQDAVDRIYDVQAIVARSYAVSQLGRHAAEGFDLCDTTHCQLFDPARATTSSFAAAARAAVARTHGRVVVFGDHVADTLFHADCGGQTAAADSVWGGAAIPYLHPVLDDLPPATHRAWHLSATTEQLRNALNADARTTVGRRLDAIEVLSRDASGRAAGLGIRGERGFTVRGDVFRAVINQTLGARALQSTRFTLARSDAGYEFNGTGFGHGVGLCQRGAAARARLGESPEAILQNYFPGTRLK